MKKKISIFAILTCIIAFVIYFVNKVIYYLSTIDNLLHSSGENYYHWRYGKIYYKVESPANLHSDIHNSENQGEDSPLLLIHDLNAHSSSYEWKKAAQLLAKKRKVYTIDLLGCGRSEKPNITYTNFLYVQMINDFIKHVIGEKTDVIATGESSSFVVMANAIDNANIGKIIMVNPSSLSELAKIPTKKTKTLKFLLQLPLIGTLLFNMLEARNLIEEDFETKYFFDQYKVEEKMIRTYCEAAHADKLRSKYLLASIKGRYTKANILPCITRINNSIYIVYGEATPENATIAEQYKKAVPAIETTSIPDTKFLPHMEAAEEFINTIDVFLDE